MNKHLLTKSGLEKLQNELRNLIDVQRPMIIREIQEAREQGDLSENADYEAAKSHQTEIESRILVLREVLNNYEIIDENSVDGAQNKIVRIGSTVTVTEVNTPKKLKFSFEIVGSIDTNPEQNKISNESAVAKAVLGKAEGDIVDVKVIKNPYKLKINKIQ